MKETKKYAVFEADNGGKYGYIIRMFYSENRALLYANKLRKLAYGEHWIGVRVVNWDYYPLVVLDIGISDLIFRFARLPNERT